jgi:HEAT repeat protein
MSDTFTAAAAPAFFEALDDPDPRIRLIVATGASQFACEVENSGRVCDAVAPLLKSEDRELREGAQHLIWYLDVRHPTVREALLEALNDPDARTRWVVTFPLKEAGPDAAFAIPALLRELEDPDRPPNRERAAICLGAIGPKAASAVEPLVRRLGDQDSRVREASEEALRRIKAGSRGTNQPGGL